MQLARKIKIKSKKTCSFQVFVFVQILEYLVFVGEMQKKQVFLVAVLNGTNTMVDTTHH